MVTYDAHNINHIYSSWSQRRGQINQMEVLNAPIALLYNRNRDYHRKHQNPFVPIQKVLSVRGKVDDITNIHRELTDTYQGYYFYLS